MKVGELIKLLEKYDLEKKVEYDSRCEGITMSISSVSEGKDYYTKETKVYINE